MIEIPSQLVTDEDVLHDPASGKIRRDLGFSQPLALKARLVSFSVKALLRRIELRIR